MKNWIKRLWKADEPQSRLPDFFISGAARCGTTSLWQYLRQHPGIYMPPVFEQKEPSHFCELYGIKDRAIYLSLFAAAKQRQRIGEASGPYLTSPESPALIKAAVPHAQFIISLRNPAERAYSLYKWMHANGYENISSFEDALAEEARSRFGREEFIRGNGQYYYNFLYYHSGLYADQVERFFQTFGREQVRVIIFEEFIQQPRQQLRSLFEFLRVDPSFEPQLEVHNPSAAGYGSFNPETRRRLLENYQPSIRRLEELLQHPLAQLWR